MQDNEPYKTVVSTSQGIVSDLPTIPDVDPFADVAPRVNQQSVLPTSVTSRLLGNLITSSHPKRGTGSGVATTVPSGQSVNIDFTIADTAGRTIMALPDVSIYTSVTALSQISLANKWPNNTYGMGTMPISVMNDWGATNNANTVTKVVVRNSSSNDVPVIVIVRWRMIVQSRVDFGQSPAKGGFTSGAGNPVGGSGSGP